MSDLFGNPVIPDGPAMTLADRRRALRRASEQPCGYAASPGTGPEGETCRSCAHAVEQWQLGARDRRWWKCALAQARWTRSIRTDIRLKSPACRNWERLA